jgi:hypothetical protein
MKWTARFFIGIAALAPWVAGAATPPSWLVDVTFPAQPKLALTTEQTALGSAKHEHLYLETGTRVFAISRMMFPFQVPENILEQLYDDGKASMLRARKGATLAQEAFQVGDTVGRKYTITTPKTGRTYEHRSIFLGQEFYQIAFEDDTATFDAAAAEAFFKSLRQRPPRTETVYRIVTPATVVAPKKLGLKLQFPGGSGWSPVRHNEADAPTQVWIAQHAESGLTLMCLASDALRNDAGKSFQERAEAWESGLGKRLPEKLSASFSTLGGHEAYNVVAAGEARGQKMYASNWLVECRNSACVITIMGRGEAALKARVAEEFLQSVVFAD